METVLQSSLTRMYLISEYQNVYYILMSAVFLINIGSPASKVTSASQSSHGTGSPVSKIHGSSFVSSTVKVQTFG